jgi:AcrR family transcriptional regulator
MATKTTPRVTARERLLAAANELFYEEGVHTVGIDRVIERAGVAKASLYNTFGSKDELVKAYLAGRHEARQRRMARFVGRHCDPREKILATFDALDDLIAERGFRGCAFVNANAEANPGTGVREVTDTTRDWLRTLFADLAREAGLADPTGLARQLQLLYDGATVSAQLDRDPSAGAAAKATAKLLLDAASPNGQ